MVMEVRVFDLTVGRDEFCVGKSRHGLQLSLRYLQRKNGALRLVCRISASLGQRTHTREVALFLLTSCNYKNMEQLSLPACFQELS